MKLRSFVIGIYAFLVCMHANAASLPVLVFTDTAHPVRTEDVSDVDFTCYQLDMLVNLLQSLNITLRNISKEQAAQEAKTYLAQHQEEFSKGLEGLIKVQQYKITQLPAMVFGNGEAVIYGQTSLNQAVAEYSQWKK